MAKQRAEATGKQAKSVRFVLDCSVTLAWHFADEANAYANAVALAVAIGEPVVPSIWPLQVANTVLIGERRGRSNETQASAFLTRLAALPITVDDQTSAMAWGTILQIGRAQGLSAYDAAYVELALREGVPLATLDNRMRGALASVGINLFQP